MRQPKSTISSPLLFQLTMTFPLAFSISAMTPSITAFSTFSAFGSLSPSNLLAPIPLILLSPSLVLQPITTYAQEVDPGTDNDNAAQLEDNPSLESSLGKIIGESDYQNYTKIFQQKSEQLKELQRQKEEKMVLLEKVKSLVRSDIEQLKRLQTPDSSESGKVGVYHLYDAMEMTSLKLAELSRRTSELMDRLAKYNRNAFLGIATIESEAGDGGHVGLEARLTDALGHELRRRDQHRALRELSLKQVVEEKLELEDESKTDDETVSDDPSSSGEAADPTNTSNTTDGTYSFEVKCISLEHLANLLDPKHLLSSSEQKLFNNISGWARQHTAERIMVDNEMWKERSAMNEEKYQNVLKGLAQKLYSPNDDSSVSSTGDNANGLMDQGQCLEIPNAAELISKLLMDHYYDGTGLLDHASFENGGSVVYALTSRGYVTPPRNRRDGSHDWIDDQVEQMYHQQQSNLHAHGAYNGDSSKESILNRLHHWMDSLSLWKWYTSYKFRGVRPYLPEDWERGLDWISESINKGGDGSSWDEFTPRGVVDSLVPDYVYHSLGLGNINGFGSLFGRTAGPEVAITRGRSVSGGKDAGDIGGGWESKPLGSCYPLSMQPEDDPAYALFGRSTIQGMNGMLDVSKLYGPKYTVRLPYSIYIDAVTLEHRSFPVPPTVDGRAGGMSAPRWVRVIGFPPCPQQPVQSTEHMEDECGERGFDIMDPIDLGSLEFHRITVSGRENDYGGDEDNKTLDRRRSIQTFAMKGGQWEPFSLSGETVAKVAPLESENVQEEEEADDPMQCTFESQSCGPAPPEQPPSEGNSFEAGQCGFVNEDDEVPICGGSSILSSRTESRLIVEAVMFIIDQNWGNDEYTCLYRVRVHGDAVSA